MVSKRKPQVKKTQKIKKRQKAKKVQKRPKEPHIDNPLLRQQATTMDMHSEEGDQKNIQLSKLRIAALKHANQMPISDVEVSTSEDKVSVPPIPGASNWVQLGPTSIPYGQTNSPDKRVLVTGRVTAIIIHPVNSDIMYVGTAQGGIWKTTDGGRNWASMSDYEKSLAIGALAMDPRDHDILYAGTGEGNLSGEPAILQQSYYGCGILKTTNGGKEWKSYGADEDGGPFSGARFFRLVINPVNPSIVFAATTFGLYRSTNDGIDWKQLTDGLPAESATDIVVNPIDSNIAFTAFRGYGVYKTANANAEVPHWNQLTDGFPSDGLTRISLGISPSSPENVYALIANKEKNPVIDKFYWTSKDGTTWIPIPLPGFVYDKPYPSSLGPQGTYNINVAVDPTTPDQVYLSAIILWKGTRNTETNEWEIKPIGDNIHTDNHAFAFDPSNHLIIYAGTDGGIYRSYDGGDTWDDVINEGLCITQFGYMDQHPNSDALILAGTQDNGTLEFRNTSAFYFSDDGDGGFVAIDPIQPNNVVHQYVRTTLYHSDKAGDFDSWNPINYGIKQDEGNSLFYAPFTLDQSNPKNIAFGSNRIFLDTNQGLDKWKLPPIKLDNLLSKLEDLDSRGKECVSAISYVNSDPGLIYVGTNYGKVFRVTKNGTKWTANSIHNSSLPSLFIWDIAPRPDNINTVIVAMAGVGSIDKLLTHVWRGEVKDEGIADWFDISGKGNNRLPDTPVNCVVIEPNSPDTMYIGTDVSVFKTTDSGDTWVRFSQGLPNCAVFDMRLHNPTRLLRAATHGRGMWEIKLDVQNMPDVDLFVRNHLMDTGRISSSSSSNRTAAFENPFPIPFKENQLFNIKLGDQLSWDMCADIKIDPPFYEFNNPDEVDYIKFESKLLHHDPQRGRVNHIYVQVHNRGIKSAGMPPTNYKVAIKILYADASNGYPNLPQDFWTGFSDNSFDKSDWKPIGETKFLPSLPKTLTNTEPTILEWDWNPGPDVPDTVGILLVIDSQEDSIPEANKNVFDIEGLVTTEKRIGLKKLNIVNV